MNEELLYISNFFNLIPDKLKMAYTQTDFLVLIDKLPASDFQNQKVSMRKLFLETAESAFKKSAVVVNELDKALNNEKQCKIIYSSLEQVGLIKSPLAAKGSVFTDLWYRFEQLLRKGVNSFAQIDLLEKFSKALSNLSDFLGSFKIVFPGLEELKELVELIQGLLSLI